MLKVLHISNDEKFIDRGIAYFYEDNRITNSLLIVSEKKYNEHVTTVEDYRLMPHQSSEIVSLASDFDVIVFHSLSQSFLNVVKYLKEKFVVWIGLGFDYYDLIYKNKYNMMMEKTKLFYMNNVSDVDFSVLEKQIVDAALPLDKINCFSNIDLFCPVLSCEHNILLKMFPDLPNYHQWNYIYEDLELIFSSNEFSQSRSIFIGNSADPLNNHIDVLDIISDIKFSDEIKIITPLSYGNNKYADFVEHEFKKKFKEKYISLRKFMGLTEYYHKLLLANTAIMAHRRQQGMGNIIMMLRLGYKIFMNEESPAFSFLRSNGVVLFSLNDIKYMKDDLTSPLDISLRKQNSKIVKDLFSAKKNKKQTKLMVDLMVNFYK